MSRQLESTQFLPAPMPGPASRKPSADDDGTTSIERLLRRAVQAATRARQVESGATVERDVARSVDLALEELRRRIARAGRD